MQKYLLRTVSFIGMGLFLPLFFLTLQKSHVIESSAKESIKEHLYTFLEKKLEKISLPSTENATSKLTLLSKKIEQKAEEKIDKYKSSLINVIDENLENVQKSDCECRKNWKEKIARYTEFKVTSLEEMKTALIDFSQAKYMEIVEHIVRDLRIVFGVNALLFSTIFFISWIKPQRIKPLFVPATLMMLSSIALAYGYFFHQNWLYTLLFNDFIGFWYAIYTLIIVACIGDITINNAQITAKISAFLPTPSESIC